MSKNIVIQEGGVGRQFTADKLKTALVGGGSCNWVPEDETQLGTKYISEDGTYDATDDGYYGYSQVTVSGIGKVTGTDPTTGEQVQVTTDPETGEIETKVIPSRIEITRLPTKLDYDDGDLLDFTGIVVTLKTKSGEIFRDSSYPDGTIPMNELVFSDTVADASKATGERKTSAAFPYSMWPTSDMKSAHVVSSYNRNGGLYRTYSSEGYIAFRVNASGEPYGGIVCSESSDTTYTLTYPNGTVETIGLNSSYTFDDKTVYYKSAIYSFSEVDYSGAKNLHRSGTTTYGADYAAWTIIYGEVMSEEGKQKITVKWLSPYSLTEYSADFEITVSSIVPA